MKSLILTAGVAAIALTPLAPASAQQMISARDKAEGAKQHEQLLEEFGGAYKDGTAPAYVARVGQSIAVQSGLSNARSDFTVTLLNSPVNNAFAVPGGYIYTTRQLMALMNNEAELAGVLGHEVGHVAANHSRRRQGAATRGAIGGILGSVLGGVLGGAGGILGALGGLLQEGAMQVAQLYTLSFSRAQETEADDLGVEYLRKAGYDTRALSTVLASLANQQGLEARIAGKDARSVPEWASTHPDPASRVRHAAELAARSGGGNGVLNRDAFLAAVNGVTYDDDPHQGVIDGNSFRQPDLRLAFSVPSGFTMQNTPAAVQIAGEGGKALFTLGRYTGDKRAYLAAALKQVAGDTPVQAGSMDVTTVNGIPAFYQTARVNSRSGPVELMVFAYEFAPDRAYHFVTIAPAGNGQRFDSMYRSVRRMSATEAAQIRARRVQVVTVGSGDTIASLADRMAYANYRTERFQVLNGLQPGQRLTPGSKVKIVTY